MEKSAYVQSIPGALVGIGAGMVIWLVLFLPITALLVQPSINRITILLGIESQQAVLSEDINQTIRNIVVSAIAFTYCMGCDSWIYT